MAHDQKEINKHSLRKHFVFSAGISAEYKMLFQFFAFKRVILLFHVLGCGYRRMQLTTAVASVSCVRS